MARHVWALTIEAPQSAVEDLQFLLPDKSVGSSAFNKDYNVRKPDAPWLVQGLYADKPDVAEFSVECAVLAASRGHADYIMTLEQVPVDGWVAKNQQSYAPMRIGRFMIHGHKDRMAARQSATLPIEMDVSCAFGTGEHPTTHGCLMMMQRLQRRRGARVLDLGTGSGVLAIAAGRLWRDARVTASDMDGPSVLVAQKNFRTNGVKAHAVKAMGFRHATIGAGKPYDVIVSNIFARPLARLAPDMARHLKPGGRIILAGFLHAHVNLVKNAYAKQRLFLEKRLRFGHWSILMLRK